MQQNAVILNSSIAPHLESNLHIIKWFWQSEADPWKERDPSKWAWTAYTYDLCRCIEKAFILNHKTADLGHYEIDFKKMVQVNKQDPTKVRRVKREAPKQSQSRLLLELPKPLTIENNQKTINHAFGNVQHFLSYITQRTKQSYDLFQRLKDLSLDSKKDQYEDIVQEVESCIRKGAQARAKIIKIRTHSDIQLDFTFEAECIIGELAAHSGVLRDFLRVILKVYTLESFICYWMNELLRGENWEELNVLTPYLVCLAYVFKRQEYVMRYDPAKNLKTFFGLFNTKRLALYRGTALTKEQLTYYCVDKIRHFSWNSVTSTSLSQEQATIFVDMSLKRAKEQNEQKTGVMFVIEADFASSEDCEGMIDISEDSRYPSEKEVILAPGTVFELLSTQHSKSDGVWEIKLRLTRKFGKGKNDVSLLGTLQEKVIFKDAAKLENLAEDEIIKAIQLLSGNQLITKLEIISCSLNSYLIELIGSMWRTTNIKPEDIVLKNNQIKVESLSILYYYFSIGDLDLICENNDIVVDNQSSRIYWNVKNPYFGNNALQRLSKNHQLKSLYEKITSETLAVKSNLLIFDIKLQSSLKDLSLNFDGNKEIKKEFIYKLRDGIKVLTSLQHLSLDFRECSGISNEGLIGLGDGMKVLTSLQHLSLHFSWCSGISNEGLIGLGDGMKVLTSLHHLSLYFSWCSDISNEGLIGLGDGMKVLTSLQHLSLDFRECSGISNEGLIGLGDGMKVLTSLQHLSLHFSWCSGISNEGLIGLGDGMKVLTSLHHLSLYFSWCSDISNEGLIGLGDGMKVLTSLQHLSLDFEGCSGISNEGLIGLGDDMKVLTSLQHLSLDFRRCSGISNEGLIGLRDGMKVLTSLQHLSLDFRECSGISNEGLIGLGDGMKVLTSLQRLYLNFWQCSGISNEGLIGLGDGMKLLTSLQHLSLDFEGCSGISNEVLIGFRDSMKALTL